jgi:hypothetical protein
MHKIAFSLIAFAMTLFVSCQSRQPRLTNGLNSVYEARAVIDQSTLAIVPTRPKSLNLFDRYAANDDALWARGWPGKLDMTGVATDSVRTCTLISPRHILMAQHYQRNVGDKVVFHDKSGRAIVRIIEEKLSLPGGLRPDIAVARLDQVTPVKFYRVLPPRDDYKQHLVGALAIITNKERNLLMRRIADITNRHLRLAKAAEFPPSCADPLITGDSGNPGFIVIHGEPILIETHTFGGMGQGPFFSDPQNYAGINELMTRLGGGYELTSIAIGP